jgi:hypothetical protein
MASRDTVPSGQRDSALCAARTRAERGWVDIRVREAFLAAELLVLLGMSLPFERETVPGS